YWRQLVESRLARHGVRVVTPREDDRRGGHLALIHPEAGRLSRALRARGVIPDFRPPDLLRLAPAPLYTSFAERQQAVAIMDYVLTTKSYPRQPERDGPVTCRPPLRHLPPVGRDDRVLARRRAVLVRAGLAHPRRGERQRRRDPDQCPLGHPL